MSELAFGAAIPSWRVRALALDLPGAGEALVVGHPGVLHAQVFPCYYGMSHKVDGHWERRPRAGQHHSFPEDERQRCSRTRSVPGYIGYGWLSMFLDDEPTGSRWQN